MSDAPDLDAITLEMALCHLRSGLKLLTPTEAEAIGRWAAGYITEKETRGDE